jgi:putative flippase GtrA
LSWDFAGNPDYRRADLKIRKFQIFVEYSDSRIPVRPRLSSSDFAVVLVVAEARKPFGLENALIILRPNDSAMHKLKNPSDGMTRLQRLRHLLHSRVLLLHESRFLHFCIVGCTGLAVDMTLLFLLSDPRMLGWGLTRSKILSAETALLNNFIWNDMWTFGAVSRDQRSLKQRIRRFLKFNLICSLGIFFNVVILNIEFNWLHMNRYIANLVAIGIVSLWNYKSNKKFSWRVSPQPTVT